MKLDRKTLCSSTKATPKLGHQQSDLLNDKLLATLALVQTVQIPDIFARSHTDNKHKDNMSH